MHSIRFDADEKLIQFIQKKADKLDTFFDRIIDGEVFMRLDKDNNMENKIIEIKLNIPKNQLFVKERAKTFEAASDQAIEALRKQIIKHKDKIVTH
jgi:putative sigma-54 modulation protein